MLRTCQRQQSTLIVLDEVINRLRSSSDAFERKIGNIMYNNRSAAVLGAIGLGGLLYPEPDELGNAIARNLTTSYQYSSIVEFKGYPRLHSCKLNNLQCPNTSIEGPGTLPAMHKREPATTPDTFITLESFNEGNLISYASAGTPQEMRELEGRKLAIGNAVSFSYWMITNAMRQSSQAIVFTYWNLDSDRGYGYKCWYWKEKGKTDAYTTLQMMSR